MESLGWAFCYYHGQYEPSTRFISRARTATGRVRTKPYCRAGEFWIHIRHKYSLTEDEWRTMLVQQSGLCALCDLPMYDPVVDHSHVSGEVRYLLCGWCNKFAGYYEGEPTKFWRVAKKLRRLKKYNIPVEDDTQVPFAALDSAA